MPRVNRPTRATVTTRLTPKTEPRAAQSIVMVLFSFVPGRGQTVVGVAGAAGSAVAPAGAGMVAARSSARAPTGGGVTAAMAVVTTPAGSSAGAGVPVSSVSLTLVWSTISRREIFQIAALETMRKTATEAVPQAPKPQTHSAIAATMAAAGSVRPQATNIRVAVDQRTTPPLRPRPAPITAPETECVVEREKPRCEEAR